jgi:hypothetical protein
MTETSTRFKLAAGTQVCEFVMSENEVDVIQGPIGSGKTRALCARIMRHAQQQRVSKITGQRMSRWFLARNTYPDLKMTTIRTWLEMFPENEYGRFNWGQPPCHKIVIPWAGGDVNLHVDFIALDKPEDVRKLRSTEYTGGAFNELAFIEKELFDEGHSRLRYPGIVAWRLGVAWADRGFECAGRGSLAGVDDGAGGSAAEPDGRRAGAISLAGRVGILFAAGRGAGEAGRARGW